MIDWWYQYLQFLLVKGFEEVLWDDLIEALLQGQKLSLDAVKETPVHVQPEEMVHFIIRAGRSGNANRRVQVHVPNWKCKFMILSQDQRPHKV